MSDLIHLLPDSIANQIAAGEVIQRPASVIKELMENSVDAGSTEIKVIIRNAGKTLIQVVDNGVGMSYVDSRMCFERHATSKISKSDDLFELHTLGFRGEALASIAAIAHVELKTQRADEEMGSHVHIEGSKVTKHKVGKFPKGTNIRVKNLFYNVPARRKFLKSDPVELRRIIDEFTRLVIANPQTFFSLFHNDNELYHLPPSNRRQRIINLFGKQVNEKIVPVSEETDFLRISGFVGKPDFTKKSRGEQFLFVNSRYIKSYYLNHAIRTAYENLIPNDHHPFFILLLEAPPDKIDINIHPTKEEIKFEDERLVYNYLRVSVKHALGKYSIAPAIDFDGPDDTMLTQERTYSPAGRSTVLIQRKTQPNNWSEIYKNIDQNLIDQPAEIEQRQIDFTKSETQHKQHHCFRTSQGYIINPIKSGLVIIDQQAAHERIVYERCLKKIKSGKPSSQKILFPETIELKAKEGEVLKEILPNLRLIGVDIEKFGNRTYVIQGLPVGSQMSGKQMIENVIFNFSNNTSSDVGIEEKLATAYAKETSIKRSKYLSPEEMMLIIDELFACELPYASPSGHKCFVTVNEQEIKSYFS